MDDEPLALSLLSDYVARVPGLNLVTATSDPFSALQLVRSQAIDLIFLDMQMPEFTGMQFLRTLQQRVMVIVTTAYSEYALEGYEHHIVDYLLKPIMLDRFMIAIERAQQRFGIPQLADLKLTPTGNERPGFIFVKTDYKIIKVDLADIYYLEGARDYVIIHTRDDKILTAQSMKELAELLPAGQFIRIHRSYLVNLSKVDHIEKNRVAMMGQMLPVSESYKNDLLKIVKG
ncbi:LytTR family DNA-binding domain-containing protein [Mucilaginibacter sp. CAU 1740]|uniref:LytR/AlgR family response regulator transcription factor n=1 Tax=Mucilaginibacter sp. CAU 1740 TaxID=3140365 RepID=UPI00325B557E